MSHCVESSQHCKKVKQRKWRLKKNCDYVAGTRASIHGEVGPVGG